MNEWIRVQKEVKGKGIDQANYIKILSYEKDGKAKSGYLGGICG